MVSNRKLERQRCVVVVNAQVGAGLVAEVVVIADNISGLPLGTGPKLCVNMATYQTTGESAVCMDISCGDALGTSASDYQVSQVAAVAVLGSPGLICALVGVVVVVITGLVIQVVNQILSSIAQGSSRADSSLTNGLNGGVGNLAVSSSLQIAGILRLSSRQFLCQSGGRGRAGAGARAGACNNGGPLLGVDIVRHLAFSLDEAENLGHDVQAVLIAESALGNGSIVGNLTIGIHPSIDVLAALYILGLHHVVCCRNGLRGAGALAEILSGNGGGLSLTGVQKNNGLGCQIQELLAGDLGAVAVNGAGHLLVLLDVVSELLAADHDVGNADLNGCSRCGDSQHGEHAEYSTQHQNECNDGLCALHGCYLQ